jgi:hypothetical protein
MFNPRFEMASPDPTMRNLATKLYNLQIDAMGVLGKAKVANAAAVLIPYLDYKSRDCSDLIRPMPIGYTEDIKITRHHWPAFSALLDTPGSSQVLMTYALDTRNPIDYRIASFHVLRYLDQNKFNSVAKVFDQEFADARPHVKRIFQNIENGRSTYSGLPYINFVN